MNKQRPSVQMDLVMKYINKHIEGLEEQVAKPDLLRDRNNVDLEDIRRQIKHCRHLLGDPLKLYKEEIEFLLIEYSPKC